MNQISVRINIPDRVKTVVVVDIFGGSGVLIEEIIILCGVINHAVVSLYPDTYLLRATFPGGRVISKQVDVRDLAPNDFFFETSEISDEHRESLTSVGQDEQAKLRLRANIDSAISASLIVKSKKGEERRHTLSRHSDSFSFETSDGTKFQGDRSVQREGSNQTVRLNVESTSHPSTWKRFFLQAMWSELQQTAVLPIPWRMLDTRSHKAFDWVTCQLSYPTFSARSGAEEFRLIVSAEIGDPVFKAIMDLMMMGKVRHAADLIYHLPDSTKIALYEELANPFAAALCGYVMLENGHSPEDERFYAWTENLSNCIDWLPDGAILHGWISLRRGDVKRAQDAFTTAALRGVPLYTAGLKLLLRGLIAVGAEREVGDIEISLKAVRSFSASVDPLNPFCCLLVRP